MIPAFAALDAAVALFKRFRTLIALAPFIALCAFLWVKLYGFLWWDGAIQQRDKAVTEVAELKAANIAATAKQIALNTANQELSQRIAADAQARHVEVAAATDRAVSDYARRNRVQDYCSRSGAGQAALHPGAPTPLEPDPTAGMVAVREKDFEETAKAAVRATEYQAFIIDNINEGLAILWPEPSLSER